METGISLLKLQGDIHSALKLWHTADTNSSPLAYLQLFQQVRLKRGSNNRQATNEILFEALETLAQEHEKDALLLRKRFLDRQLVQAVANWLNVGESTAYRKQQKAIERLALILQAKENRAKDHYQAKLEKRLKLPPEVVLVGVKESLAVLLDVLTRLNPPWLITIQGLGGIGKTALANALIRQPGLTNRFCDIAWVSAKRQDFLPGFGVEAPPAPALTAEGLIDLLLEQFGTPTVVTQSTQAKRVTLTKLLKEEPHLIVIDNLETVVDYEALLPTLRLLANPSKFLLTSRHSLSQYPDIFCRTLAELSPADTRQFIRQEAKLRGLPLLLTASESELNRIYQVVGGNPLALKLVIGQISVLPLSQVLENLKHARSQDIDKLYSYIYWQAWHTLDETGQKVFLVMPLVENGSLDQLISLSGLEPADLSQALRQLVTLSLVQVGGELEKRCYSIHRLTESFLLNEAIKWQTSP